MTRPFGRAGTFHASSRRPDASRVLRYREFSRLSVGRSRGFAWAMARGRERGRERKGYIRRVTRCFVASFVGLSPSLTCHHAGTHRSLLRSRMLYTRVTVMLLTRKNSAARHDNRTRSSRSIDKPITNVTIKNNVTHGRYFTLQTFTLFQLTLKSANGFLRQ